MARDHTGGLASRGVRRTDEYIQIARRGPGSHHPQAAQVHPLPGPGGQPWTATPCTPWPTASPGWRASRSCPRLRPGTSSTGSRAWPGQEIDGGRPGHGDGRPDRPAAPPAGGAGLDGREDEAVLRDSLRCLASEISEPPAWASQVIQALKAMLAGGRAERSGYHDRPDGAS